MFIIVSAWVLTEIVGLKMNKPQDSFKIFVCPPAVSDKGAYVLLSNELIFLKTAAFTFNYVLAFYFFSV